MFVCKLKEYIRASSDMLLNISLDDVILHSGYVMSTNCE